MARILIIEDDTTFAQILEGFLKKNGHTLTVAYKIKEGRQKLQEQPYDLLLLDYRLPDGTGMDILDSLHGGADAPAAIIMTSFHDIRTAVRSVRKGAYDYITKPVNPDELLMLVNEAWQAGSAGAQQVATSPAFVEGVSDAATQLHQYIALVAPTDMSVIIQGESGTGKEQAARTIHNKSKRGDKPFVAIDCGALSAELAASELFGHLKGSFTGALQDKKGMFEAANRGTLFLDEVGNLSYEVQVKLLRAIQEREIQPLGSTRSTKVDVRIITATNEDLVNAVKEGKFREDLYHRLNEFKIKLPSLQERKDDLELFIDHFVAQANRELGKNVKGLSDEVRSIFYRYEWPGNLRELKNIIKRAVLLTTGTEIPVTALPEEMADDTDAPSVPASDIKATNAANEKELIIRTLQEVKYNKSKAAKLLNIDRTTLYYKMSKYGIEG